MENQNILNTVKHIHFIGIGGSGMCPIAEILYHRGYHITGSDISESETVQKIRSYQIPVIIGQKAENINGADLIVYTAAVKKIILNWLLLWKAEFPHWNALKCLV